MIQNLAIIFNASLAIGYYPQQFKNSIMIFIPKEGKSPIEHINYRPISLLNIPGKILEKIFNNRILQHLEMNNLQNPRHHGFRKNRGTHTAIAILSEFISTAIGNGNKVNVVLRDISKSFDKVWHDGLRIKLIQANLPSYLIRIISNYLENRTAAIRIGTFIGQKFPLLSGVPQGGCVSPTLFALYTADLPPPSGNNESIVYADDITQIIQKKGSENYLARKTAREIIKINEFENKWKIKTNIDKFQIIPVGRLGLKKVIVNNQAHEFANRGKVLGTIITKNGFPSQASNRINLAKSKLSMLHRFTELSPKHKRTLYKALIKSILEYPPVILNTISKTQAVKMQQVQNKATRIITKTRLSDRKTNKYVNELAELTPINISIHEQAKNTWQKIEIEMDREILDKLELEQDRIFTVRFPSARQKCNTVVTEI